MYSLQTEATEQQKLHLSHTDTADLLSSLSLLFLHFVPDFLIFSLPPPPGLHTYIQAVINTSCYTVLSPSQSLAYTYYSYLCQPGGIQCSTKICYEKNKFY